MDEVLRQLVNIGHLPYTAGCCGYLIKSTCIANDTAVALLASPTWK